MIDLTLRCPTCGRRADMCFDHGEVWKKRVREPYDVLRMTEHELRAAVNEFTEDDPPPYGSARQSASLHMRPEAAPSSGSASRGSLCSGVGTDQ